MTHTYTPAWWVPGAHLHTLWGRLVRRGPRVPTHAERWETPDGDFVDVRRLEAPAGAPRLLLLHGLEGTPRSHYVRGILAEARRRGWGADLLVFRGCGGELNRARRFYHSGETADAAYFLDRVAAEYPETPLLLAGVSLGGNVLLKLLGERGRDLPAQVKGAAAVSVPYDLMRSSRHIDQGFSRVYQRHFLRSLRRKALAKLERYPDLVPAGTLDQVETMYAFDDRVTAPIHGFRDAADYYERSSSIRWLDRIRVPALLLSAIDDPFLPPDVLEEVRRIAAGNPMLEVEFVDRGGHVGFVSGHLPWRPLYYAEWRLGEYFAGRLRSG
jgi:predicted alpha/beta-fold hydrolase